MIEEEYEPVIVADRQVNILGADEPVEVEESEIETVIGTYPEEDTENKVYVERDYVESIKDENIEQIIEIDELPSEDNILSASDNYKIIVVSGNSVEKVTLDNDQYQHLVELIEQEKVVSVSADFVSSDQFRDFTNNVYIIGILIFGILFGYFCKESLFKGF